MAFVGARTRARNAHGFRTVAAAAVAAADVVVVVTARMCVSNARKANSAPIRRS